MSRSGSATGRAEPGAEGVQEDIEAGHVARTNGHGSAARPRPLLGSGDWRKGEGEYRSWDYIERLFAPGVFERNAAVVSTMRSLAEDSGISVGQLALAWLVSRPGVTCAIPGAKSPEQAIQNAGAADIELDPSVAVALDAVLNPEDAL